MSSNFSKIKVGRVWGYPIVVTTGKSKHEAILLNCDDNPQEFLEQHVNVKIRWKVAGYTANVPVSDVELQNIDTSYYRPRGATTGLETPSQQSEEAVTSNHEEPSVETEVPKDNTTKELQAETQTNDANIIKENNTGSKDMRKPDDIISSGVAVKTEEAETDSGGEDKMDERMPEAVTSGVTAKMEDPHDTDDGEHEFSDGCLGIPKEDCNNISFFRYINSLSIRELLCWALQTETKIRLAKIERRLGSTTEEDYSYSKTLNSNFLIDIYPTGDDDSAILDATPKGHDEYKYSRKAHTQITFMEKLTEGLSGLTPIEIEKKRRRKKRSLSDEEYGYGSNSDDSDDDEDKDDDKEDDDKVFDGQVVPPTMLHFEIILEAFMGYSLGVGAKTSFYNSPNSSLPRAAIMGGAVVAALTSYQDRTVVEAFDNSNIFNEEGNLQEDTIYWGEKIELIKKLHNHFLYKKSYSWSRARKDNPCSIYAKGDVDIFLQPSPLTQGLIKLFTTHGIGQEQIDMIGGFIGNVGLSENDLELFVSDVMDDGAITAPRQTEFAYAVSKRAVSFILGSDNIYEYDDVDLSETFWPRSSQFIMLDNQADLLGGLFDFDMSAVACSYDGVSVRVAPRAALSLMAKSNFVTPYCFEEHRNKRRVIKYASRGFKPFLVDPHDNREKQCVEECDPKIKRKQFLPKHVRYYSEERETKAEIDRIQREKMKTADRVLCCHAVVSTQMSEEHSSTLDPIHLYRSSNNVRYTMKMFETTEGDAVNFYKDRFCWTEEDLNTVKQIDPYLRVACERCRNEYNLIRVVMAKYPELMAEYDLEDDHLRCQFSYSHSNQASGFVAYEPSFYGGGVFDNTRVRDNARPTLKILSMMHSQTLFELSAHVMKHGSPIGYKKRFVYGSDLVYTIRKAQRTSLQQAARPPIGLNPERFVERCEQCHKWLLGNRYSVKDCQNCSA